MSKFSFKDKFVSGESYYAFWNFVSKALSLVITFITISTLTVYQYGVFQLILSTYSAFMDFLGVGSGVVNNDILRNVSEGKEREAKQLFFEYNGLRLILGTIL